MADGCYRHLTACPRFAFRALALGGTILSAQGTIEHDGQIKVNAILAYDGGFLAVRHAEPGPANSMYVLAGEWR